METKTSVNIELNADSVSIQTIIYEETNDGMREISNNRKAYINTEEGRAELIAEQSEATVLEVLAKWNE